MEFNDFWAAWKSSTDALLIDVRTPEEFESGSLKGAINVDYLGPDLLVQLERLDQKKTYFVFCRSCRRSTRVCTLMQNSGFGHVYNLEGGLKAYNAELLSAYQQ